MAMRSVSNATRSLRTKVFSSHWRIDEEIQATAATLPSHSFLANPSGQYSYVYLTQFVKTLSQHHFGRPFSQISVLDWGCGKGHVSKLIRDLGPKVLESCDVVSEKEDSAFGQETPLLRKFNIPVTPLEHEWQLPYPDGAFDVILSVGVLEHVPNERASLTEIKRVLTPGGLFFCFFLPTNLSWGQKIAHWRGNYYHDRFYNKPLVTEMLGTAGLDVLDIWYRQFFPKSSIHYPNFRFFEKVDQSITENTPLRYFATNIELVAMKPKAGDKV